jgi:2-dehydro-3-deoxyphosphogluconate aldolase/(4S)-4-hydroxy-2-oxoglutarate aldolase
VTSEPPSTFTAPEGTVLCGMRLDGMTREEAVAALRSKAEGLTFSLEVDGKTVTLTGQGVGLTLDEAKLDAYWAALEQSESFGDPLFTLTGSYLESAIAKELEFSAKNPAVTLSQTQAKFIVTPGYDDEVTAYCVENNIPIFPGCPTTSDIQKAIKRGLKVVKFFPAEAMGGLNAIKAVAAPYGGMLFMPTGGVSEKNLNDYLAFDKIIACGGSWMAKEDLINAGKFDEIEAMTRSAVQKMLGFEIKHVGINCGDDEEAMAVAKKFSVLFGWPIKDGNSSVFAGSAIEAMKAPYLGAKGHIAVGCNSVVRAQAYLESMGFEFNAESAKEKNGKLIAIYLKDEIGGFAVHLVQK